MTMYAVMDGESCGWYAEARTLKKIASKIGSAKVFDSSVSSISPVAIGRPTIARLSGRTRCGSTAARLTLQPAGMFRPRW